MNQPLLPMQNSLVFLFYLSIDSDIIVDLYFLRLFQIGRSETIDKFIFFLANRIALILLHHN